MNNAYKDVFCMTSFPVGAPGAMGVEKHSVCVLMLVCCWESNTEHIDLIPHSSPIGPGPGQHSALMVSNVFNVQVTRGDLLRLNQEEMRPAQTQPGRDETSSLLKPGEDEASSDSSNQEEMRPAQTQPGRDETSSDTTRKR